MQLPSRNRSRLNLTAITTNGAVFPCDFRVGDQLFAAGTKVCRVQLAVDGILDRLQEHELASPKPRRAPPHIQAPWLGLQLPKQHGGGRRSKPKASPALVSPAEYRLSTQENQTVFWSRFGVGQGGGSRYENSARTIPLPVALLIVLREKGRISDADLAEARQIIEASREVQEPGSGRTDRRRSA